MLNACSILLIKYNLHCVQTNDSRDIDKSLYTDWQDINISLLYQYLVKQNCNRNIIIYNSGKILIYVYNDYTWIGIMD